MIMHPGSYCPLKRDGLYSQIVLSPFFLPGDQDIPWVSDHVDDFGLRENFQYLVQVKNITRRLLAGDALSVFLGGVFQKSRVDAHRRELIRSDVGDNCSACIHVLRMILLKSVPMPVDRDQFRSQVSRLLDGQGPLVFSIPQLLEEIELSEHVDFRMVPQDVAHHGRAASPVTEHKYFQRRIFSHISNG